MISTPRQSLRILIALAGFGHALLMYLLFVTEVLDPVHALAFALTGGAILALVYVAVAVAVYIKPTTAIQGALRSDVVSIQRLLDDVEGAMTSQDAIFYAEMVIDPYWRTTRISDRVNPTSRAYTLNRTVSFVPPQCGTRSVPVPIDVVFKRSLVNQYSVVGRDGSRLSTLSKDATIAHTAASVRHLVAIAGRPARDRYVATIEPRVLAFLVDSRVIKSSDGRLTELAEHVQQLGGLTPTERTTHALGAVVVYLRMLASHYPVVTYVNPSRSATETSEIAGAQVVRLSTERRVVPVAGKGLSRPDRAREALRTFYGIRPARFVWSLAAATRARSYHFESFGPDGTYLGRQQLSSPDFEHTVEPSEIGCQLQPRLGQRFCHLYVHDYRPELRTDLPPKVPHASYVAWFFERPPGAVANAAMAALCALVVTSIAAASRLTAQVDLDAYIVALLLTLPIGAAAWLGFGSEQAKNPAALSARVQLSVTMLTCLVAAGFFLLGPVPKYLGPPPEAPALVQCDDHKQDTQCAAARAKAAATAAKVAAEFKAERAKHFWERDGARRWILIFSVLAVVLTSAVVSWAQRAITYRHFARRPPADLTPQSL